MKKYNVAVVGATGLVGNEILNILDQRDFPYENLYALASERSAGKTVEFGNNKTVIAENLWEFDFSKVDIVLSSPGASVSKEFAPIAAKAGAVVIDNTSYFRTDEEIPLVVPEVNPEAVTQYSNKNIIANPNCSTIQMLVALKPIHDEFNIKRVVVSTYQSVSGSGKAGMDELGDQSMDIVENKPVEAKKFTKQIAFNVIPHIDVFMDDLQTKEEWKMEFETHKILSPEIKLHANCARIPVFNGHSEYINIETEKVITPELARKVLETAPGIKVVDDVQNNGYTTPVEVEGADDVFISRIRQDKTTENGLSFWCVADNLRKGAALNAVQIAEELVKVL